MQSIRTTCSLSSAQSIWRWSLIAHTGPRRIVQTSSHDTPSFARCQRRHATTYHTPTQRFRKHWEDAKRDSPFLLSLGVVGAFASTAFLGFLIYDEVTRIKPQFAAYPPAVEQELRLALHAVHLDPDPLKAEEHFLRAIDLAEQAGMNPYSAEVMGMRTRLAQALEQFGQVKSSVEVLNSILKIHEEKLQELKLSGAATVLEGDEATAAKDLKTQCLKGILSTRAKLAELYASDYIQDNQKAVDVLSDGVQVLFQGTKDAATKGLSEDNELGMSLDEITNILAQMGQLYLTNGQEDHAIQTLMLALDAERKSNQGQSSCTEVAIISDIAAAMYNGIHKPGMTINGRAPTKSSIGAARRAAMRWAEQAVLCDTKVKAEDRDARCYLAAISATVTCAALMREDGKKADAKVLYEKILPQAQDLKLKDVVHTIEAGLRDCAN